MAIMRMSYSNLCFIADILKYTFIFLLTVQELLQINNFQFTETRRSHSHHTAQQGLHNYIKVSREASERHPYDYWVQLHQDVRHWVTFADCNQFVHHRQKILNEIHPRACVPFLTPNEHLKTAEEYSFSLDLYNYFSKHTEMNQTTITYSTLQMSFVTIESVLLEIIHSSFDCYWDFPFFNSKIKEPCWFVSDTNSPLT